MLILAHQSGIRAAMTLKTLAFSVTLAVALSACAELGPPWPWEDKAAAPRAQAPKGEAMPSPRAQSAPKAAKAPDLKAIRPEPRPSGEAAIETAFAPPRLVGLSENETAELLGRPAEEEAEPPGKIWIYRAAGCRLSVHLFPDMEKGGFYTLDYTAADGAKETCLNKVAGEARRKG